MGGGALIEPGEQAENKAVEATRAARITKLPIRPMLIDPPQAIDV